MTIYSGFAHWTWWFSIFMLVYQRVRWIVDLRRRKITGFPTDLPSGNLSHTVDGPAKSCTTKRMVETLSGWWFQTFFVFHFIYGMSSFPLTNSYFSRWLKPPTSYESWDVYHLSTETGFLPWNPQKTPRSWWNLPCLGGSLLQHLGTDHDNEVEGFPQTWGGQVLLISFNHEKMEAKLGLTWLKHEKLGTWHVFSMEKLRSEHETTGKNWACAMNTGGFHGSYPLSTRRALSIATWLWVKTLAPQVPLWMLIPPYMASS